MRSVNCERESQRAINFHFLSDCFRQHPNTFGFPTSLPCGRESSRCVQHFQSLLLAEGPALSPWYLNRWENGCLRAKHNHHLYVRSYQIQSAMLFCIALTVGLAPVLVVWLRFFQWPRKTWNNWTQKMSSFTHFIGSARKSQNISSSEFLKWIKNMHVAVYVMAKTRLKLKIKTSGFYKGFDFIIKWQSSITN